MRAAIHVSLRVAPVRGALSHGAFYGDCAYFKVLHNNPNDGGDVVFGLLFLTSVACSSSSVPHLFFPFFSFFLLVSLTSPSSLVLFFLFFFSLLYFLPFLFIIVPFRFSFL